ncbi:MAG: hypothetical protein IT178_03140 [Acidobacteria bacterium]|nr:hypothetical protein [Acidobacteriota bacterium]
MTRQLSPPSPPPSTLQNVARIALGAMLLSTGISHLTFAKRPFHAQVPASIPLPASTVVEVSGVAEIAIGASLIALPRHRVPIGLGTAAFLVAVFPGNISQYIHGLSAFGLDTDAKRFGRLFAQPLFVAWALYGTGAWDWLRNRR